MDTVGALVRSIFQRNSLQDCSLEDLQNLALRYPYFTPVQFLLAEKLKSEDENLYKKQLQKLSLHFSDPLWLDYLLSNCGTGILTKPENEHKNYIEPTTPAEEKKGDDKTPIEEAGIEPRPETSSHTEGIIDEWGTIHSQTETNRTEEKYESATTPISEGHTQPQPELYPPGEEMMRETETRNFFSSTTDKERPEITGSGETFVGAKAEVSEPFKEETDEPSDKNLNAPEVKLAGEKQPRLEEIRSGLQYEPSPPGENVVPEAEQTAPFVETNAVGAQPDHAEPKTESYDSGSEQEIQRPTGEAPGETQISIADEKGSGGVMTEPELKFEPYHTVDYFASLGIKYIPEEKPADRFGQQLKSFTEWLKTLKRLPQTEIIRISNHSSEERIQQLADHSINEGDVVTETMAEVWMKQGNKEKAVEIYQKLSLLNPDKSAYFASLVEQLKNS